MSIFDRPSLKILRITLAKEYHLVRLFVWSEKNQPDNCKVYYNALLLGPYDKDHVNELIEEGRKDFGYQPAWEIEVIEHMYPLHMLDGADAA